MSDRRYQLAMIGLGVMGRNFLLNLADHGHTVAGYDKDAEKTAALEREGQGKSIGTAHSVAELAGMLERPRAVMMLVPAGSPVDSVIHDLLPHLEPGDVIIDGGNSHFSDTDLRAKRVAEEGLSYLGVGVSGGEAGARHGPSIMPGGDRASYERVAPLLESAAAKVDGDPCVTYLGPGSAGHYVKMVHNGIEYGLMQLIAETYDIMKRGLGLGDEQIADVFGRWNDGPLAGYLIEITSRIFRREDARTDEHLIDMILDEARQKGTGRWTSQDAMDLQVPVPTIDIAVAMRNLSALKQERERASRVLEGPPLKLHVSQDTFLTQVSDALYASMIVTYAQGLAQLRRASDNYEYGVDLESVARIWRGGCIIRSALLEDIRGAYQVDKALPSLMLDQPIAALVMRRQEAWRMVVQQAIQAGIPVPAITSALTYFDAYRSEWLPANLIEAQRDFFGAHTFERIDAKGVFHVEWTEPQVENTPQAVTAATGGSK